MRVRASLLHVVLVSALAMALVPAPGFAQHLQWPEHPKNLKVLKNLKGEQLRPVMQEMTHGLGVRCNFCHVGQEGQPITSYDFASDEKPEKQVARKMLEMVQSVHGQLEKLDLPKDETRVEVTCYTCHRGRPKPLELHAELSAVFHKQGADSMAARYHALKDRFLSRGAYDFGEGSLNELGYELLAAGEKEGALRAFQLNVEAYPQSANAYDSLAEAYLAAGQRDEARTNYRKSLELDPKNENAAEKLKEIDAAPEGGAPSGASGH
ncbi:MAG: c-type cytochrome [bacterium]